VCSDTLDSDKAMLRTTDGIRSVLVGMNNSRGPVYLQISASAARQFHTSKSGADVCV
jgi:hypothetical protein